VGALLLGPGRPAPAQNLGLVVRDGTLGSGPLEVGPASIRSVNPRTN
jgi:hypothetical protein